MAIQKITNLWRNQGSSGQTSGKGPSGAIRALVMPLAGFLLVACASAGPEDGSEASMLEQALGVGGSQATGGAFGQAGSPGPGPGPEPGPGSGGKGGGGGFPSGGSTGSSGGAFPGGAGGVGGGSNFNESVWTFDDCFRTSLVLRDTSVNAADAMRSSSTKCVPGATGQGVQFKASDSVVEVGNRPVLALDAGMGVAAWINASSVTGNRTIVRKAGNGGESFSLRIENKRLVFSVGLRNGRSVSSSAPIKPNKLTHVGGLYDGQFAFLFINGQQVGQVAMKGRIRTGKGPIQIGNDGGSAPFNGIIDEVWFSTSARSGFEVQNRACITRPATLVVTPATSGPVQPDTAVPYEIRVTNNNLGCGEDFFQFFFQGNEPGFSTSVDTNFVGPVPSGQTATFRATVTGSADAEPGVRQIPFSIFSNFNSLNGALTYELAEPTGCFIRTSRELMIKGIGVVDDPVRTNFDAAPSDPRRGAWTFGSLARNLAPTPEQAPKMVEQMFQTWLTDQQVNSFTIGARPAMQFQVLDNWPRTPNGELDLDRSPLQLLAIVNRPDLRSLSEHKAGEGRFVFGVVGPFGQPLQFTVILEYDLPATTPLQVVEWAQAWHALGALQFPSEQYNTALQALTDRFAGRGAAPTRPNGSALGQLRTNEIDLGFEWEFREFTFGADGFLKPSGIKLTPDRSFNFTNTLADFINQNEASILAEQHVVPDSFQGQPFLGGSVTNNLFDVWFAPGVSDEARHKFSLNTCNGCHSIAETGTRFLAISPRSPGQESVLSPFMTGILQTDPNNPSIVRNLNDLARRRTDMMGLVCPQPVAASAAARTAAAPAPAVNIAEGIGRVH